VKLTVLGVIEKKTFLFAPY